MVKSVLETLGQRKFTRIVEYGSGDGVMTKELLRQLTPDGRLLAVELKGDFVKILNRIEDQRLQVVRGRVQDVASNLSEYSFCDVDLVVSSIPFSLLSRNETLQIVRHTFNSLVPGGSFVIFHQYSRLMRAHLRKYFKDIKISFEPRNILPCFILHAQKSS